MLNLATIRSAAKIAQADTSSVVTEQDERLKLAFDELSRAEALVLVAIARSSAQRRAWTRTVDSCLSACSRLLASVHRQQAAQNRTRAQAWADILPPEFCGKGLADVEADAAAEIMKSIRGLPEPPPSMKVIAIVAALLAALATDVDAAGRANNTGTLGRLRRLPHAALSPRLAARPRGGLALSAAA